MRAGLKSKTSSVRLEAFRAQLTSDYQLATNIHQHRKDRLSQYRTNHKYLGTYHLNIWCYRNSQPLTHIFEFIFSSLSDQYSKKWPMSIDSALITLIGHLSQEISLDWSIIVLGCNFLSSADSAEVLISNARLADCLQTNFCILSWVHLGKITLLTV